MVADEIDGWVLDALKAIGCDTAKSVDLPVEDLVSVQTWRKRLYRKSFPF